MSEQSRIWPEIPRLPGERLLQGVPHTRAESVFSEAGMPDACDVLSSTQGLNSKQRRIAMEGFVSRTAFGKDVERSQATVNALGRIAEREVTDSNSLGQHASFIKSVLEERFIPVAADETTKTDKKEQEVIPPYPTTMNIEWANGLINTNLGKSSRRRSLEKDDVLAHTVTRLVSRDDRGDPAIIEAGAGLYNRFTNDEDPFHQRISDFAVIAFGIIKPKLKQLALMVRQLFRI